MSKLYLLFKTDDIQKEIVAAHETLDIIVQFLKDNPNLAEPEKLGQGWEIDWLTYDATGKANLKPIKKYSKGLVNCNAVIYDFESPQFETYLKMIKVREDMKNITLLVIKGEEKCKDVDLLVTLGWVIRVKNNKPDYYCPWELFIEQSKDNNELTLKEGGWFTIKLKYENSSVDKLLLLNLIDNLASTNNFKGDFSGDKSYTVQAADIATHIVSGFDPIVGFLVKKGIEHLLN